MMSRFILFLLLLPTLCTGQSKTASRPVSNAAAQTFILKKINISGSKRFTEADIIKATGLKAGGSVTPDDLKQAANRLGQSGVFSQVGYRYNGETAEFNVVDAPQFVPATFENFVWFSDAELNQRVHNSVPLFDGNVPLNGNLAEEVAAALTAIAKEKGVQGTATALMSGKIGELQSVQFRIDGISLKIGEIRFVGAAPEHVPLLLAATKKAAGENYQQTFFGNVIKFNAPTVYGKLGFLKAQFGTPKPVILKDDPVEPLVAIDVPVQEGDQYYFQAANWTGAGALSTDVLAKTIDLKVGAPADTTQLARDLAKAKEIYGTKGYMNAQIKSTAALDSEKHTAIFNLAVNEGSLYHMGKLEVQGPDAQRAELAKRVWEMHEGDVYDASYVKTFLQKHPKELAALNGWFANFTQTIHDDTHVVDLSLKFEKFQQEAK